MNDIHRLAIHEGLELLDEFQLLPRQDRRSRGPFDGHPSFAKFDAVKGSSKNSGLMASVALDTAIALGVSAWL